MISYNPSTGDILCSTRTTTGTIITIPAGRAWSGNIFISASVTSLTTATPRVSVSGANAEPADTTIIHQLSVSGLAAVATHGEGVSEVIVRAPAGNSVTLEFNTGGATSASVSVTGFLL